MTVARHSLVVTEVARRRIVRLDVMAAAVPAQTDDSAEDDESGGV